MITSILPFREVMTGIKKGFMIFFPALAEIKTRGAGT